MNLFFFIVAIIVGLATVVQAGLNKKLGTTLDLNFAVLMNSAVVLIISASFYVFAKLFPQFINQEFVPQSIQWGRVAEVKWFVILPGICGFLIVMGIPFAIGRMGALRVFLIMIFSQVLFSALWDYWIEGIQLSPKRWLGALITLLGAVVSIL